MKLRRLVLENYRIHARTEVEFPDGVTAIVGRNGSGKSSLLEAIGFAFFGVQATRTSKDLLRFDGAAPGDALRVTLECELADQAVRVTRELRGKNGTAYASLDVGGQTIVPAQSGSSDAVTAELRRLIGLDRDAFFTTVFSQQKELGRLASHTPAERKRLILGMLGIDALDEAIRVARRRRSDAEVRVEALRESLPDLNEIKGRLAETKKQQRAAEADHERSQAEHERQAAAVAKSEATLADARAAHEARREAETTLQRLEHAATAVKETWQRTETQRKEAQAAAEEAKRLGSAAHDAAEARRSLEAAQAARQAATRRAELHKQHQDIEKQLQVATEAAKPPDTNGLEERLEERMAASARHQHAAEAADAALRKARDRQRRIASLGAEAACPVCDRPLDDHLPRLHEQFDAEIKEQEQVLLAARTRHSELAKEIEALQAQREHERRRVQEAHEAQRRCERLQARRDAVADELTRLPEGDASADLDRLQQRLAEAQQRDQRRIRAEALAERTAPLEDEARRLLARQQAAEKEVAAARARLEALPPAPDVPALEQAHRQTLAAERAAERRVAEAQRQLAVLQQRQVADEAALQAAERDRQRLREAQETLEHWQLLASGRGQGILERFRTHMVGRIRPALCAEASRLLARFTGGRYDEILLDDEYRIFVADGGVHYAVERFSGGETDLVHLALRLAVSRLLLERSGVDLRLLVLDEVFGSLDDERRELVLSALQELGGLYSQVLVVTHHDALRDALDSTLLVEADGGEAHVTMHNG